MVEAVFVVVVVVVERVLCVVARCLRSHFSEDQYMPRPGSPTDPIEALTTRDIELAQIHVLRLHTKRNRHQPPVSLLMP